jgi:hypothetical protein
MSFVYTGSVVWVEIPGHRALTPEELAGLPDVAPVQRVVTERQRVLQGRGQRAGLIAAAEGDGVDDLLPDARRDCLAHL